MSTQQRRKSLAVLNDNLRTDNSSLKSKEAQLLSHIQTLIRRQKQLVHLKAQLIEQIEKSRQTYHRQRNVKEDKCIKLSIELQQMGKHVREIDLTLVNLEEEYQVCLRDYDTVLGNIAEIVEKNKIAELQLIQESQKKTTLQTMIFDFQRLERVLEQERKYFRELENNEHKTHVERMKQFQSIRAKLVKEEKQAEAKKFIDRVRIGLLRLDSIFKQNFKTSASIFFRGNFKFQKITQLGISKLQNCLQIGTFNQSKQMRFYFTKWHGNAFPSTTLNNLVQNTLRVNIQSKTKIKALNKIMQKLNADNLSLLHLYERTKIICSTVTSIRHKEVHLTFCQWRQRANYLNKVKFRMENFARIVQFAIRKSTFNVLRENTHFQKRFEIASHLLTQYQNSKDMSWALRTWRLQVYNRQIQTIQRYIQNIKNCNQIQKKVKYERRKVKSLTILQLSLTKIQIRNYFSRYYQNVKLDKIQQINQNTQQARERCVEARKQNKNARLFYKERHRTISLTTVFGVLGRFLVNDPFQEIKRKFQQENRKRQIMMLILLKKEGKCKYYAMNQLRKNVQHFQKKQMHQVLTDLNRKMEQINQKSTQFREALKKTVEQLGSQSSKKINQVFQYTFNCQKKVYFNWHTRMSIKKNFKNFLISRSFQVFTQYTQNNVLKALQTHCKDNKKQLILAERQAKFLKQKSVKLVKMVFKSILNQLQTHKKVFSKFIHVQNVMYFYRLEYAMISIMKKAHIETVNLQHKGLGELTKNLQDKSKRFSGLKSDRHGLEEKLKNLFANFINFQDRSQRNKQLNFATNQKQKYFRIYRQKVQKIEQSNKILTGFVRLLEYKNYFIFWKSLIVIKCQNQQVELKEQLGKINKKKKTFDQKSGKLRTDTERKMAEQETLYESKKSEANYYVNKYEGILTYYDKNHESIQKKRYLQQIFTAWKRQYIGTRKFGSSIYSILRRVQLISPYRILLEQFRKYDSKYKSQLICIKLINKNSRQKLLDGFNYWRYNMRHGYSQQLKYKVDHIDEHHQQIREGILQTGQMYATEVLRNRKYGLVAKVFMAFKNEWIGKKHVAKRIAPLLKMEKNRRVSEAMRNWKWLMFYKRTKRSYLAHKKSVFQQSLKQDVITCLKIHRQQIYNLANLSNNFIFNITFQLKRFAMSKILNIASFQKNQLKYQRRRALHTLIMKKTMHQKNIKRTVMWKWQSQLIKRKHYLCNALKSIQLRILRSAFANVNQKKYWNDYYIKDIADKITTEGYSDVNSVTNILVREGFDPDQLKEYLKVKNERDNKIITRVLGHLRTIPQKEKMVQAFHSWVDYVQARKNIKRALSKVFNFSTGLGRYFDRWKKKDPAFNQLLQRESRENMLERYKQLERLMREYKRDIKDSLQHCDQLRQINDQHAKSTRMTVQMALGNIAHSVHKGMKQGLQTWRLNAKQARIQQTNQRYDELVDGIQMLDQQKRKIKIKIKTLESQNVQLKQKCKWGEQCGELLKKLINEKDGLTIDLAEKQHNLKILLQDNLRLKQKIKIAQESALKLINKVRIEEGVHQ